MLDLLCCKSRGFFYASDNTKCSRNSLQLIALPCQNETMKANLHTTNLLKELQF